MSVELRALGGTTTTEDVTETTLSGRGPMDRPKSRAGSDSVTSAGSVDARKGIRGSSVLSESICGCSVSSSGSWRVSGEAEVGDSVSGSSVSRTSV